MNFQEWAETIGAFSSAGAAIFAGWAAIAATGSSRAAREAARASQELVLVERSRDDRLAQKEVRATARAITVSLALRRVSRGSLVGADICVVVRNGGAGPVFDTQIRITFCGLTWGPVAIGALSGGDVVRSYCHIAAEAEAEMPVVEVLFCDGEGRYWTAGQGGRLTEALGTMVSQWRVDGDVFRNRVLPDDQRGTLLGLTDHTDFASWRALLRSSESPDL